MTQMPQTDAPPEAWMRIAATSDLAGKRPVIPVTAYGHKLVLFRDDEGQLGLIGRFCPHRGADLCYGRHENNGLRCPFHGWHFDRTGQCTDQPAEPADSTMYKAIRQPAFPVTERGQEILAWFAATAPAPLEEVTE